MNDLAVIIGRRIRNYRNQLGLTQEELGSKCGLYFTYIGQLERGEKNATLDSIQKVATGLGISLTELFENIEDFYSGKNDIALRCYELISSKKESEQAVLFDIVTMIEKYSNR